ncbi:hypothetical protein ACNKHX_26975 [Shigella flexneri]
MPHFIVECSDNIREEADLRGVVRQSESDAGGPAGIFRWRVLAAACIGGSWQMADGQRDYAFVHMTLKISRVAAWKAVSRQVKCC